MDKKLPVQTEFLLRRLHSLTGLLPLTGFLAFHLYMNSASRKGGGAFNGVVDGLRGLPYLPFIEWGLLLGPFIIHIALGLWIVFSGQSNVLRMGYARNWAYVVQRTTALIIMVFVIYHVVTMKYVYLSEDGMDYFARLREKFANPVIYGWYAVGIAAAVIHLANGVCTFCMTWGLTIGKQAQRYTAYALTAAGLALFAVGIGALNGFIGELPAKHQAAITAHQQVALANPTR